MLFLSCMISKAFLVANGTIHARELEAFAVDSEENIYLGYRGRIDVYHNGDLLRTIKPPTNREYVLKIENDKLLIGRRASGKIGIFDLDGNFLEDSDLDYDTFKKDVSKEKIILQNGKTFKINKHFNLKPFEVLCDDTVIYRMAAIDYIYNGLPFWLFWAFTFLGASFLILMVVTDEKAKNFFR